MATALLRRARSGAPSLLAHPWQSPRWKSTLVPAVCDVRQLALPVAFVTVRGWGGSEEDVASWAKWSKLLAKAGYSNTLVELESATGEHKTSSAVLEALEQELAGELAGTTASYPPLLISSGLSTLVAQQYVSSHPLSGLLLVSPVPESTAHDAAPRALPTHVDDFTFEPEFPVGVMVESEAALEGAGERLLVQFGEVQGGEVKALIGAKDAEGFQKAMNWMDESGL